MLCCKNDKNKEQKTFLDPLGRKHFALKYDDVIFNVAIVATSVIHTTSLFQTLFAAVISLRQLNSRGLHGGWGEEKGISFYQM